MRLFNFKKNKEEDVSKSSDIDKKESLPVNKSKSDFSLLCMNFGVNDYSFTLTANGTGKIIISDGLTKKEFDNIDKVDEIKALIDDNLIHIKEFISSKTNNKDNNMLQIELSGEKYTLFRGEVEDEMTMFYDRLIFDLANIVNINKSYENIELALSFEYPSDWERIKDNSEQYCLLSNSKVLVVFENSTRDFITFEYINSKKDIVDMLLESIKNSEDYDILKSFEYEKEEYFINCLLVNYKEKDKIELFSFINLNGVCLIMTVVLGDKDNVDISQIEKNAMFKKALEIIEDFKFLNEEDK